MTKNNLEHKTMTTYSNPRLTFTTNNWPYGSKLTIATFLVEQTSKGERVSRETINPKNGRANKPKKTTYSLKARIVDGSDGKIYIAELSEYGFITIMQSNLQFQQEVFHPENEKFQDIIVLFDN